jgi:hypothetical protein
MESKELDINNFEQIYTNYVEIINEESKKNKVVLEKNKNRYIVVEIDYRNMKAECIREEDHIKGRLNISSYDIDSLIESIKKKSKTYKPSKPKNKKITKMENTDSKQTVTKKSFIIKTVTENPGITLEELSKKLGQTGLSKITDPKKLQQNVKANINHISKNSEVKFTISKDNTISIV